LHLTNRGTGMARGVDVFLRYGEFLRTRVYGRIAYSLLDAERLQARHRGEDVVFEDGPPPFGITHNLTLVGNMQLYQWIFGGLTLRYATGRPVTPIEGALFVEEGAYYLPLEGPVGSDRVPDFIRLDAQLNYNYTFGDGNSAVFYLSVSNVLGRRNVINYEYSGDYSTRTEQQTD